MIKDREIAHFDAIYAGRSPMKADRIRALPINRLGLTPVARRRVTEFIGRGKDPDNDEVWGYARKALDRLAEKYTVDDLISVYSLAKPHGATKTVRELERINSMNGVAAAMWRLVEMGMTHLDWNMLPCSTVTPAMLKRLKKEELLKQSILVLNTLSSTAAWAISEQLGYGSDWHKVTVGQLLNVDVKRGGIARSLSNTRRLLRELGFSYKDGVFLQFRTRRKLVESLMRDEAISRKTANLVAIIAAKQGWVEPFQSES